MWPLKAGAPISGRKERPPGLEGKVGWARAHGAACGPAGWVCEALVGEGGESVGVRSTGRTCGPVRRRWQVFGGVASGSLGGFRVKVKCSFGFLGKVVQVLVLLFPLSSGSSEDLLVLSALRCL